jgi:uncharacterized RDD family membrane protein YckC
MSEVNPYQGPEASESKDADGAVRYMGFWLRVLASIIDNLWIGVIGVLLAVWYYGPRVALANQGHDLLFEVANNGLLPFAIILCCWCAISTTPGKLVFGYVIVDAITLRKPSPMVFVGRYLGYIPCVLSLGLGLLWVAWDPRKQGWHDKLAGTVVIKARKASA